MRGRARERERERQREGQSGERGERGGRKGHYGSAAPALCASTRIKDEGGWRGGRARKEKVNGEGRRGREGGREKALGEEGTTDIHHKAGCSGADGRGCSSRSECRKLPECTAAAVATVASPSCARYLPSSVEALRCAPPWHFRGNRQGARVIRPVIP